MFFMLLYSHTGQGAWRLNTNLVDIRRSGPASFLGPWSSYPWATHPVLGMFHRPLVLLQMYGFEFGLRVVIPVQNWTVSRKSAADTLKILWFLASLVFTFKDLDSLRICSHQVTHIQHHLFWWVGISEKFWCDFESHCWARALEFGYRPYSVWLPSCSWACQRQRCSMLKKTSNPCRTWDGYLRELTLCSHFINSSSLGSGMD